MIKNWADLSSASALYSRQTGRKSTGGFQNLTGYSDIYFVYYWCSIIIVLPIGLCQICQHNLKHNRGAYYASIMLT